MIREFTERDKNEFSSIIGIIDKASWEDLKNSREREKEDDRREKILS